jgi:signal transduction histidine kinase
VTPAHIALAQALRAQREALVTRWLDRIAARVSLLVNDVFPSETLLNHVPLLIDGIAGYLESAADDLDAQAPVIAKARELGALRHAQGFDAYQLLKEYELLSGVLMNFLVELVDAGAIDRPAPEIVRCAQRLSHAVELIRQATAAHFLRLAAGVVREREERLRRFNRMVAHELKNRVSAITGAVGLLDEAWISAEEQARFVTMARDNLAGLRDVLESLESLSRLEADSRQQRNVLLPHAAAEAARQLREMAHARGVRIEVDDRLPAVEVNAAAVELCLRNYLSNAIKYADQGKADRWARVTGEFRARDAIGRGGELEVRVADNGIGVPAASRDALFEQFFRAPNATVTGAEGSGLGLSLVRETVESLGGRAWVEFREGGGTEFAFCLPSRRDEDAAAAGITRV